MASQFQQLSSYLPPGDGFLPLWLLFISAVSIGNSIQAYVSLAGTREVYAGQPSSPPADNPRNTVSKQHTSPVTELSARTFGTWTGLSSVVRLYAAYHIHDQAMYELALWTFGIAFAHFMGEWLVYRTARLGKGMAGPMIVPVVTWTWMLTQWTYYVK